MKDNKKNSKTKRTRKPEAKGECFFCKEKKEPNFLESDILARFTSERGKILSRGRSSLCSKHQRKLTSEIKRARYMALLPFIVTPE